MKRLAAIVALLAVAFMFTPGVASANISATRWANGTIYFVSETSSDSWTQYENDRIAYLVSLHDTQGVNWSIVNNGTCHVNYPCIHIWDGYYGTTGWTGLTTDAYTCSAGVLCSWDGSTTEFADHTSQYWTTIKINKSYATDAFGVESVFCHEEGHAVPELQHASGSTCMQASGYNYNTYQASEVTEIKNKFASIPR